MATSFSVSLSLFLSFFLSLSFSLCYYRSLHTRGTQGVLYLTPPAGIDHGQILQCCLSLSPSPSLPLSLSLSLTVTHIMGREREGGVDECFVEKEY